MANNTIKISASILSANFLNLGDEIRNIESAGIDSLHLDIMDNHLAPNISFGPPIIKPVKSITSLPLDTHLMIDAPWLFFDDYIAAGSTDICFHIECYDLSIPNQDQIKIHSRIATDVDYSKLKKDIKYLQEKGVRAGVTINPNTAIDLLTPILDYVDYILVMSVHPGFSGQSFIPNTLDRINAIRQRFDKDIHVDGGVNNSNAMDVTKSGGNVLISASYQFGSNDYKAAIDSLRH